MDIPRDSDSMTIEIHGDCIVTRAHYPTGETVEKIERFSDADHKETIVYVDGDVVFHGSWIYRDMEWRLSA